MTGPHLLHSLPLCALRPLPLVFARSELAAQLRADVVALLRHQGAGGERHERLAAGVGSISGW